MDSRESDLSGAKFCDTNFPPRDVDIVRRDDGVLIMRNLLPLHVRESSIPAYLRRHSQIRPDAVWLARRAAGGGDWIRVTFGEARKSVDALTQGLIDLGIGAGQPLAILSGSSLEHALIGMAAMQVQSPVTPISPAYSLQSEDFGKLRDMLATVEPRAIFVQDGVAFGRALEALGLDGVPVIVVDNPRPGRGDILYADLAARKPGRQVEEVFAAIDPAVPAKFMFTSGSTGSPKAVPQTQRNICVAVESILHSFGQTKEGTMVRMDWAPWSHVFGAANVLLALMAGGTLYIDDGRPVGPLMAETVRNLREVSPTTYANVPAGFSGLLLELEKDDALARNFFARLDMIGYAAASLPGDIARRLQQLAVRHRGCKIPITSGYGATETCPAGACVFWPTDRTGLIGLAQPGYEIKLVPIDDERFELRIRGEAVMSGYHGRPDLNAEIFDEEGFYRMGDAVSFLDPRNPLEGMVFAGRLTEEFKLQTGIFVRTGVLRLGLIDAADRLFQDVVICGENRPFLAILAWLDLKAAARLAGKPDATREELNADPLICQRAAEAVAAHNQRHPGSSTRIERVLLLDEPPSIDLGEVTDKGSINQRAVQRNRPGLVEMLYAETPPEAVMDVAKMVAATSPVSGLARG